MSSFVATKAFFSTLSDVVDHLIDMFPDDVDFMTFKTFIGMVQKSNPKIVINTFHEELSKFEKYIDEKDEKFLLEYKAVNYGAEGADIFEKVKSYWSVLDDQTKDSLWQYFYILKELCKKAYIKPA
jgi:hypothetical protein